MVKLSERMLIFLLVAAGLFSRVKSQHGCFLDYNQSVISETVDILEKIYADHVLFSFSANDDVTIETAEPWQIPVFIELRNDSVPSDPYKFSIVSTENVTSLDDDTDLCSNSIKWGLDLVCMQTQKKLFITFDVNYTNDHDPVINHSLRYQIQELVPNDTLIKDLTDIFIDRDCAPGLPLQAKFSIEDGNTDVAFRLASSSKLVVNRLISYQKETHFELNISVTTTNQAYQERTGFGKIDIDIIDIDDNDPVFDNPRYILRVQEENHTLVNQATETVPRIFAFDQDRGVNDNVTYSINGSSNIVQIGQETGFVWTTRVLDRETEPLFEVTIRANQVHNSWRSAVATLVVEVEDINDNRPMFSPDNPSVVSIPEHSVKGSFIVRVFAIDADIGENANFSYTLGSAESVFDIKTEILGDQTYGTVTVANSSALDRERMSFLNITVSTEEHAPHQGGDCSSGMCSLNITIELTDINDNSPVFDKSSYILTLRNNTKYAYIGKVHATDADEETNAEVMYQCLSTNVLGNDACSVTTINVTTGDIWLNQSLVSLQTHFALVEACDSPDDVSQTRCRTVPLTLNVSPNVTVSLTSYNFTIYENLPANTYVGEIQNYDDYFQLQDGHFQLDDKVLRTNISLDREKQDAYIFVISTNDQDNTNISVEVTVLDVNDNTPVFNKSSYTLTVWHNTKDTHIGTVNATDADEGTNAEVRYQCLSVGFLGSDACIVTTINHTTGDIWLNQSLVSFQTYFALVEACDSPDDISQKRCTTVPLRLSLPTNSVTSYNFTIHENLPPETYVGEIQNYDQHFQLQDGHFTLDDKMLRTNVSLDREKQDVYIFVINTNDQDNTNISVQVTVLDMNDNTPVFNESSYTLTIRNNTKDAHIGTVYATDADEGTNAEVRYQCLSVGFLGSDACIVTTINDTTGDIWLNQSLISLQTYFALVEACDSPDDVSQTRCTTVPLRLSLPTNSVTSYNFTIQENLPLETYVGEIQNYDEHFQLQDGHFQLEDKVLRTNVSLDREKQDVYIFEINAKDQDNTNISVEVTVLDVNDNTPVFNESSYTLTVWDNTKETYIGTVYATDADEGTNAEVRYQCLSVGFLGSDACIVTTINDTTGDIWLNQSLVSLQTYFALVEACDSPDDVSQKRCTTVPLRLSLPTNNVTSYNFTIHENLPPETYVGEIQNYDEHFQLQDGHFQLEDKVLRTNVSLDREEQDVYIFVINTNDQDNTNISVEVTVLDMNDNTPVFNKSSYTLIDWNNTEDAHIGTAHATDADEGTNAEVRYQCLSVGFLGNDACSVITINDTTGDIWLNQSLVSLQTFFALMEACDSPDDISQKRCTTVPVRFSLPFNDTISVTSYNFTIYENLPPEAYVGEIQNYDEHFQLQDGLFQLDNKVLRTKVSLDREEQQLHTFVINTNDQENTNISVEVTVLDVNDNAPVFDPSNGSVRLSGSEIQGQIITVVNATDDDKGVNAEITYSLQPQSMLQYFRINATSGVITLHTLPSSNMETMELLVKAADGGSPSLSGFYTLQIILPSAVRNGSAVIYASLASDKIKSDKDNIQSELGRILGVDVIITEIRQESANSSILYITARKTSSDYPLTSEELQSLVDAKPVEIADLFRQHDSSAFSSQKWDDFTTPVIVLIAVGGVLLVALIISIVIIARNRKSEKRYRRLIKSLSLSASIYDTEDEEDTATILGDTNDENNAEAVDATNPVFADDRGENITMVNETEVTSPADTQSAPEGEDQDVYENASAERAPDADSGVPSDRENGQEDVDDDTESSSNDSESPLTKPRSATYLSAVLDEPLRGSADSHDLGADDAGDVTSPETYVNLLDGLDGFPHPDESLSSPPLGDGLQAVAPDEPPVDFEEQASYVPFQDVETGTAAAAPLSNDEAVVGTYLDPEVTSPDDMADTGSLDDFPVFPISARFTPPMVRKTREQRLEEELEPLPAEPLPDYGKKVRFNFQVTEHEVPEYSENDAGEDGAELPDDPETTGSNDGSDAPTTASTTPADDTPTGDSGSEAIGQEEQDVDLNQEEEITSF